MQNTKDTPTAVLIENTHKHPSSVPLIHLRTTLRADAVATVGRLLRDHVQVQEDTLPDCSTECLDVIENAGEACLAAGVRVYHLTYSPVYENLDPVGEGVKYRNDNHFLSESGKSIAVLPEPQTVKLDFKLTALECLILHKVLGDLNGNVEYREGETGTDSLWFSLNEKMEKFYDCNNRSDMMDKADISCLSFNSGRDFKFVFEGK